MQQKYFDKAVFLAVYITEAHAKDEWPCGKTLSFCTQPKSTEERCELASLAQNKFSISVPMLVDTISNSFEQQFASWPFRFYGLRMKEGSFTLSFKPQPELDPHFAYDVTKLENWLIENI